MKISIEQLSIRTMDENIIVEQKSAGEICSRIVLDIRQAEMMINWLKRAVFELENKNGSRDGAES